MNIDNNGATGSENAEEVTTQEETTQVEEIQEEKPQETPEARLARLKRQYEREAKKLGIEVEKPSKSSKANDFDYSEKAFLAANGIKGLGELKLAKDWVANTGKSIDDLVENKYFQQELKDYRETLNTSNATPTSSKRSTSSTRDTVEYWLAKPFGELPENFDLRKKVVEARRKQDKSVNPFG